MAKTVSRGSVKKKAKKTTTKRGSTAKLPSAPIMAPAAAPRRQKRPMADEPRIGALSSEAFEAACSDALGGRGWQKAFRRGTGFAQSTLTRYLRGIIPVPQHVATMVEMMQTLRRNGLPLPDVFNIPE